MKFYLVLDYTLPGTWPKSTQAEIQNDGNSLGLVISLKARSRLSHLIKRESLFSLRQYYLDFPIFIMIDSKFYFSPTFTSKLFFWTRNKNDICLKHMISSTLVKYKSMIISIVMPSYPYFIKAYTLWMFYFYTQATCTILFQKHANQLIWSSVLSRLSLFGTKRNANTNTSN